MGIPLLRGRGFGPADRLGSPKVVLVNETAARRFWPNEDPIGKPIGVGQGGFGDRAEIVGVVGDVRYGTLEEVPNSDVYICYQQSARNSLILYVRGRTDPASLAAAIRAEVRALNRDLPVYDVKSMRERIGDATVRTRFSAVLLAVFASIALVLAAVGIYGVMSYAVTARTRELGIRIALGADAATVLALVLRRGLALTLSGLGAGVVAALAATRALKSLLYEVQPSDPATYAMLVAVLGAVALLASYLPARRATRVDPLVALRTE
jgi:predicted permease